MEQPEDLCVDASVLVKWFVVEEGRAAALAVRDHAEAGAALWLPASWSLELTSGLYHKVREGTMTLEEARRQLAEALHTLALVTPLEEVVQPALELSARFRTSVWDAVYLVVALDHDAHFFTADRELYRKVSSSLPRIHLVSW